MPSSKNTTSNALVAMASVVITSFVVAVLYIARNMRPPFSGDENEVATATRRALGASSRPDDREPLPASDHPALLPAAVPRH